MNISLSLRPCFSVDRSCSGYFSPPQMTIFTFLNASENSGDARSVMSLEGVEPNISVCVAFILAASFFASFVSSSEATETVSPLNRGIAHSLTEKSKEKVVMAVSTLPLSVMALGSILPGVLYT